MLDLDRFITELDRLTTTVHFYDEVYCDKDTIKVVSRLSSEAARLIQLSVHNDIIMSASRLLFDGKEYKSSENHYEYLSQYNLATKYESYIDSELQTYRENLGKLKESLNVKNYRDLVLAHNDKATLTGESEFPKHNMETKDLLIMLKESRALFFGIRLKIASEQGETGIPVSDCSVYRNGVGYNFIRNIKYITKQINMDR